jgi:ribosome-associated toxin RatA of RatAB toxin-antitoxin module
VPAVPDFHMSRTTSAPAERVWALVKASDRFSSFMDEVTAVDLVDHANGTRTSSWSVRFEGAVLEWIQNETVDEDQRLLSFSQVDGDLGALSGAWRVSDDGGGSRVVIDVWFDIGIPLLADLLDPPALRALEDNFRRLLDKIEVQVQRGGEASCVFL